MEEELFLFVAQLCLTICDPMDWSMPGFPVLQHLPKFAKLMSIELVMPSNHLILCHPLLFLPSTFPSIRISSNESAVHFRWPKHWSFSFSISPYNEYSRLTSFSLISLISLISLLSKGLSRIFSSTTVRRHQFFGAQPFLLSSFYIRIWLQKASLRTKLVEVREFQLSYFRSWKMTLWKCCTQYASKFGKLSSGHRTGKGPFSFQSQRKAIPKNAQTTAQLHSSHTLVTATSKSLQSCLTLCDPIPGILQARTLEWVAISFSNA